MLNKYNNNYIIILEKCKIKNCLHAVADLDQEFWRGQNNIIF